MDAGRPLVDWRTTAPYAGLAACGRHGFAWEWLRRSPAYRAAVTRGSLCPERASFFGLHRLEPVGQSALDARPVWRGEADPHVLTAIAAPARDPRDAFDVSAFRSLDSCVVTGDGSEHWLWSDGIRQIRLDIVGQSLVNGPVRLDYRIAGVRSAEPLAATLARLLALHRTGRLVRSLFAPEPRAARWALVLRTHDALAAGATQRHVAEALFGLHDVDHWRVAASADRDRVRRLVTAARTAARTDPRHWLDGSFP
ncbi:DUF2285 domain-containing protein [Sphingobium phenoxybenzoativorans]|uniref:DUF2285 domain-containing protein n=1 Tax=Sphingobium phenoxybenzoativorans TaxID=1592790 RepID=A0A975Q1B3_9SPHN|nr:MULTISPECIES: DUF2285 domain-containing protein [Sphingobium]QUT05634.1 DUF2285 domain-containing protein [Sphingobium phenoxybenzoativorans]WDA39260.1 DUF2285 domain-containing protein [Sphingobium sp. YC-XJ3]